MFVFYAIVNALCVAIPFYLVDSRFRTKHWRRMPRYSMMISIASLSLAFFAYFFQIPIVIFKEKLDPLDDAIYLFQSGIFFFAISIILHLYDSFRSK